MNTIGMIMENAIQPWHLIGDEAIAFIHGGPLARRLADM